MDIALAIDVLVPAAQYFGSVTDNTLKSFEAIHWHDEREKPTWEEVVQAWNTTSKPHVDTPEEIRIREIDAELSRLDFYAQRPLCSIVAGLGDENDEMLVQAIEAIKIDLRDERRLLLEPKSPVDEEMEEDYEEVPEGEGTVEVVEYIERSGE